MEITVSTHGKVILFGEHAVVYGYDALSLPVQSLQIKTTLKQTPENTPATFQTDGYAGPVKSLPPDYRGIEYLLQQLIVARQKPTNFSLCYQGRIPMERGLGSSAAVALGTVKAINQFYHLGLSEAQIIDWANQAETVNHGSASGLDVATVNSHHLIYFNKKNGSQKIRHHLGAYLVISDSGELGNTREAVAKVRLEKDTQVSAQRAIEKLGTIAQQAKIAWEKQDVAQIGQLFDAAQANLRELNISTTQLENIMTQAKTAGALGSKLSGGGLGGIVISLTSNRQVADQIVKAVQPIVSESWIEEI